MNQQMSPVKAKAAGLLPAATQVGPVTLRVAEAERSLAWYRDMIGLELIERTPERLVLGAGGKPFLILEVKPGTAPRIEETTGLYHLAILVPDRPALAAVLARIAAARVQLGASDHLVSEALYIWDPDGNGNEVYRDRPRAEWTWARRISRCPRQRGWATCTCRSAISPRRSTITAICSAWCGPRDGKARCSCRRAAITIISAAISGTATMHRTGL
jgi:catechol 2,3-dioxygenase-like lactoylglutathione lyase family enzyme